ncbi:hypothetical protein [Lysinibacillus sp. FSL L8-0126]|uniref:hypothetical protein n=1 Tax=Lysinibacillus sp. FSL L8-0126 TaxID=2921515 RepID=UPI00315AB334
MKKLHLNGHSLTQNEKILSFASFSEDENKTYYYQYNGEDIKEISRESYAKIKFDNRWGIISSQLEVSNYSYIESIAKCWISEGGKRKLISLSEYYNNTYGEDWGDNYDFDIIPNNIFSDVTNFMTCAIRNETICLLWPHNIILHFNEHDQLVQYILLETSDYYDTLHNICSDGQAVWSVSPTMNSVVKYRFPSFEIEKIYRYTTDVELARNPEAINDDLHVIYCENELIGLQYPEYISYINEGFYICDMENKRIATLNPNSGKIDPYIALNSKPFEFLKYKNQFVIQTDTGIYLLNENEKNDFFD